MRFVGVVLFCLSLSFSAVKPAVGQSPCTNGLAGIETAGICCTEACGSCGGSGCRSRPGGNSDCCTGYIASNGDLCSVSGSAPCIVDDADDDGPECSNGLAGYSEGEICCEESCGMCGGAGCKNFPGGKDSCCMGAIEDAGVMCADSGAAPCIMEVEVPDTYCSNGMPGVGSESGDVCCPAGCGECGGSGCKSRPGGKDDCCTGAILDTGVMCDDVGGPPCIINDAVGQECDNGLAGVQSNSICCLESCGDCGGVGCGSRDGGAEGCCTSMIMDFCNVTNAAPCVIV